HMGFVAVGFSRPKKPLFFREFCSWVNAGKHGEMAWLEKYQDLREDPTGLLAGCQTVISLAYPYSAKKPITSDGFTAARYTEPRKGDYHDRLKGLARRLAQRLSEWYPGSKTRVCVDSAPILERSFAYASGIGFIGKNNMLIVPGYGSYIFLVEILTTAVLALSQHPPMKNQCGSCSRCLELCPTGALEGPFSLDASKCLSYLTIEYGGAVDRQTGRKMSPCFFGCDVCQEACPFNEGGSLTDLSLPSTEEILSMGAEDFERGFGHTAFARAGLAKVQGNIRAVRS
ncbi:MAG: tRNA epoxyqueuosine(34) reductase QueG, partial [Thermodesulfobacteriota bacterium]|nr:tRNA epoxyqueuosine(34) reductase QueG [Thermodesulfobacteriota bacterium]